MTTPVTVILRLAAKDPEATTAALRETYDGTMAAEGIRSYDIRRDQGRQDEIVLVQSWDSRAQQEAYIAWRAEQGDLTKLVAGLTRPPEASYLV
ncbi:MAG: antibiotic biosynthesis monooxygenase [Pseudomonadota bacterium]